MDWTELECQKTELCMYGILKSGRDNSTGYWKNNCSKKKWSGTTGGSHVKNKNKIKSLPYAIYKKKM